MGPDAGAAFIARSSLLGSSVIHQALVGVPSPAVTVISLIARHRLGLGTLGMQAPLYSLCLSGGMQVLLHYCLFCF